MKRGQITALSRHRASDDESVRDVPIRVAATGDEDAKALVACGLWKGREMVYRHRVGVSDSLP